MYSNQLELGLEQLHQPMKKVIILLLLFVRASFFDMCLNVFYIDSMVRLARVGVGTTFLQKASRQSRHVLFYTIE